LIARRGDASASTGIDGETKERFSIGKKEEAHVEFVAREERKPCGFGKLAGEGLFEKIV
jgi:hypothetical protein